MASKDRPPTDELTAEFMSLLEWQGSCLIFTGKLDTGNGYGRVRGGMLAHRYAYSLKHKLDPDLDVLHTCDVRRCVLDEHLYQGTNADNIRDKVARGRSAKGGMHNAGYHIFQRAFLDDEALDIKKRWAAGEFKGYRDAGIKLGVSHQTIRYLIQNKYYRELNENNPTP